MGEEGEVALDCPRPTLLIAPLTAPAVHDSPSRLHNFPSPFPFGPTSDHCSAAVISEFILSLLVPLILPAVL